MPSIDADVVLVAEGRDSQIDARPALFAWLGLGVFDRPARVAVLLAQLGGVVRPLRRDAAFFDVALFAVGIALFRATIEASMIWPLIARNPAAANVALNRSKRTSIAGLSAIRACVSASRNIQIVFASGTVSPSPRRRKRMNDSR